jgi:hypothetical protein
MPGFLIDIDLAVAPKDGLWTANREVREAGASTAPATPPRARDPEGSGQETCRSNIWPSRGAAADTCFLAVGRSFS